MTETAFTPVSAALGGLLIGSSVVLLLWGNGRIAGISGVFGSTLGRLPRGERGWRGYFLGGLVIGGLLYAAVVGAVGPVMEQAQQLMPAALGAALVGFGTSMGSGCTSGHGICGLSRWSTRSLVATLTFMALGFATVYLTRHFL